MIDNNDSKPIEEPINDVSFKEELKEKSFNDGSSTPTAQNPIDNSNQPQFEKPNNNNNQSQNYNSSNNLSQYYTPPDNPQEVIQTYPGKESYNTPQIYYNDNKIYNNDIKYNNKPEKLPRRYPKVKNPKILVCLSIFLIFDIITDIVLQIILVFSPYTLADDALSLTMAIIYLFFIFKCKSLNIMGLVVVTSFIWFGGLGLRFYGLVKLEGVKNIACSLIVTIIRSIILLLCVNTLCNKTH